MTMRVEWRNGFERLPEKTTVLVAFPGIGNIGKVAVNTVREMETTVECARLHPLGLPPLAELDEDGLLAPPHLSLSQSTTSTGKVVVTLTGKAQPNEPAYQSALARELMDFFEEQQVENVLVLAGMIDQPQRKETFAVASSAAYRIDLESKGVDIRRDEPKSGAIGLSALLASMGPLHGLNSACIISSTVGSSGDLLASQRMLEHLEKWFAYGLKQPADGGEWLKEQLNAIAPKSSGDHVKELTASHDAFYM